MAGRARRRWRPRSHAPPELAARARLHRPGRRADGAAADARLAARRAAGVAAGDLWRWDGFIARAEAPRAGRRRGWSSARRLAEIEAEIARPDAAAPRPPAPRAEAAAAALADAERGPALRPRRGPATPRVAGQRRARRWRRLAAKPPGATPAPSRWTRPSPASRPSWPRLAAQLAEAETALGAVAPGRLATATALEAAPRRRRRGRATRPPPARAALDFERARARQPRSAGWKRWSPTAPTGAAAPRPPARRDGSSATSASRPRRRSPRPATRRRVRGPAQALMDELGVAEARSAKAADALATRRGRPRPTPTARCARPRPPPPKPASAAPACRPARRRPRPPRRDRRRRSASSRGIEPEALGRRLAEEAHRPARRRRRHRGAAGRPGARARADRPGQPARRGRGGGARRRGCRR